MEFHRDDFGTAWFYLLRSLTEFGDVRSPRGLTNRELMNVRLTVQNGLRNLLVHPARRLSYKFAVAEWLWIWYGRADVATIARYNRRIADFSDDGITFNGAYGTPVTVQWPRVLEALKTDPDTRQAVIAIYRPPTGPTKDVPCTISVQFLLRDSRLNAVVTMRSSDIWLGLPYDFFNFSMFTNILAAQLSAQVGWVSFNLGSSHLYDINLEDARAVLKAPDSLEIVESPRLTEPPPTWLEKVLTGEDEIPISAPFTWTTYSRALTDPMPLTLLRAL